MSQAEQPLPKPNERREVSMVRELFALTRHRLAMNDSRPALADRSDSFWARLFVYSSEAVAMGLLAFVLLGTRPPGALRPLEALVFFGCGLPLLLARCCYLLINRRVVHQRFCPELPNGVDPAIAQKVLSSWSYEITRTYRSLSRAECFASLWGLTTTMVLIGATAVALPYPMGFTASAATKWTAFAAIGAASVGFVLELARVCVRTANDDATKRMLAEALRTLVLSVVVTIVGMLAPKLFGNSSIEPQNAQQALSIGVAAAIVGVPAFEFARRKIMHALKINDVQTADLLPLNSVTGMSAQEIARLSEEGIESVEALVNTPIPRLFLSTRFSLHRICDWMDRGVLLTHLGVECAAKLRASTGIARACELRRIAGQSTEAKNFTMALQRAMHLESEDGAALMASAIAADESVALIQAFRETLVVPAAGMPPEEAYRV